MLSSMWLKSVINPIPKGSNKDPFVPLNYRGIRLSSCVSKVFCGFINKKITVRVIIFMKMNKMCLDVRDLVKNISIP